jgi:hypothetical protein
MKNKAEFSFIYAAKMLLPVPLAVLTSNPQFAGLHKILTTELLDPAASTKATYTTYRSVEEQINTPLT